MNCCGGAALGGRHALELQAEGHALGHRQPGKQRVLLEHHAAMRIHVAHLAAIDHDAAGAGRLETGDQVQQRGRSPRRPAPPGTRRA